MRRTIGLWMLSGLGVLGAMIAVLGLCSAPASAAFAHRYLSQISEMPAGPTVALSGPFGAPAGMVENAGNLYIGDTAKGVVDELDSTNAPVQQYYYEELLEFGAMNQGIAVDSALGYAYATAGAFLFTFNSNGELVSRKILSGLEEGHFLTVDNSVDPSDPAAGDLYFVSGSNPGFIEVVRPEAGGEFTKLTKFEGTPTHRFGFILGVAVDEANGDLVVASERGASERGAEDKVDVFKPKPSGSPGVPEYEYLFSANPPSGQEFLSIGSVTVDAATDDIYVSARQYERLNEAYSVVVDQYSPTGEFMDRVEGPPGSPFELKEGTPPEGVAVGANGDLYVSNTAAHVVDVFGPTLTLPDVRVAPGSGLQSSAATVNGSVAPNGQPVSACVFEYGTSSAYGASVPCSPAPGAGSEPVGVSADIAGLEAGKVYHYRLAATGAEGITEYSVDETLATAPAVQGHVTVSGITSFAATLSGVLQTSEATPEYHFAYGLNGAYGSVWPQPDATASVGGSQTVTQTITGLQPNTTYHVALVASDFGGGSSTGQEAMFTTRPLVPPLIGTGAAVEVQQTGVTLTGSVDPQGLATTYSFQYGTSSAYGSSWPLISVFAGSGSVAEAVAVEVPNLQPGSVYHYRLVASNEDGASYGADQTFATPGYAVVAVQEPPVLTSKLGFFNPETGHKPSKSKGKTKKKSHSKAKGKHNHKKTTRGNHR